MEIITAKDISSYQTVVDSKVEESTKKWIRNKLSNKVRAYKKEKSLDNSDYVLTEEEKSQLKTELLNSEDIKIFQQQQKEIYQNQADNYKELREYFEGLNELNEYSADIESFNIQTTELKPVETVLENVELNIVSLTRHKSERYKNISNNKDISRHYISNSFDEIKFLKKIRDMYDIQKDFDDIELFELYDMKTNIDFSHILSSYYRLNQTNIINEQVTSKLNEYSERLLTTNVISNDLLSNLLSDEFITNNQVTCYKSTYTTTNTNKYIFSTRTLGELLFEITNPKLTDIPKENRQQIYTTYDGTRPKGDEYYKWNGLQVFDIDLKEWPKLSSSNIESFKQELYNKLINYHWFLWVVKSASGKGIHIYTKSAPAHHIYTDLKRNNELSQFWFNLNYLFKVNLIYDVIDEINSEKNWFVYDNEFPYLDNVVSRITAGIRLTNDLNPKVNPDWIDLHCSFATINIKKLQELISRDYKINKKLKQTIDDLIEATNNTDAGTPNAIKTKITPKNIKFETFEDYTTLEVIPRNKINYILRYNVVNTLAHIFGKDGLEIAHYILQSKLCGNEKEITAFYSSALTNRKEPTKLGLEILTKCNVIRNTYVQTNVETNPEQDSNNKESAPEQITLKQYTDNIFKNGIRKAIEYVVHHEQANTENVIQLKQNEFLTDILSMLEDSTQGGFTNDKINILLSPPGTGKTHTLLQLARAGKRILLVEPFISVIKNKVERDSDLLQIFETFYGDKNLNDIEYGMNAITTFDKFSKCNYEKISKMFDYVCIDESHLLFTSSYRIEATSSAVRKLKELYFISSNDPFSAKIILMTGTETGDTHFFGKISNVIRVNKKGLDKKMEFLICDDGLDAVTRLSYKTYELLKAGYRIMIPTNKGEIYSHKLIGMLEHLMNRPIKYGYYKRSNVDQDICKLINEHNTIGDYEIIFCSNYLSVGVDIIDKYKFASLYFGPFSGYEIEQFNARIRKTSIYSIYCIQTETNSGETNALLLEEPKLNLQLTEEDVTNFIDDKEIANAKQEFIAQYDPVLHKITTPGFSWLNGAIRFNKEEYELIMFENKFLESMVHPVKIAKELVKYGYEIIISDEYEGLKMNVQEELKEIGKEAAKQERIRKHSLLVGTFLSLIDNNTLYTQEGLEFNNVIKYIGEHRDIIEEDREQEEFMRIEFNLFGIPQKIFFKSKEAFETMYNFAKYLSNKYSQIKAKDILMQYVSEEGILKMKQLKRSINLLKLIDKNDSNELAEPVFKILERMYNWIDVFQTNKNYRVSYNTFQAEVDAWCNSYIDMLGIKISTNYGYQKIKDNMLEMLNDIATRSLNKAGIRYEYNTLPDTDNVISKYKQTIDMMIENTFKIVHISTEQNKQAIKSKHIILEPQGL